MRTAAGRGRTESLFTHGLNDKPTMLTKTDRPTRIGLLYALREDTSVETVLKYLVLHQNTLQGSFEFSFLPVRQEDALLERLRVSESSHRLDASAITLEMPRFYSEYMSWLTARARNNGFTFDEPDELIIISRARFANYFYFIGEENWSIIALGDWDAVMAPPSVVESALTLLVQVGIIAACGESWPRSHLETKGCLFDFTENLKEARYKALTGFICASCRRALTNAHSEQLATDAQILAERNWLGDQREPTHISGMARQLGYSLFRTRGFSPSLGERIKSLIEAEGVKAIIKIASTLLIAGLLLWLGLGGD